MIISIRDGGKEIVICDVALGDVLLFLRAALQKNKEVVIRKTEGDQR